MPPVLRSLAIVSFLVMPGLAAAQDGVTLRVVLPGGAVELRPADLAQLPRDSVRTRIHDEPEHWFGGHSLIAILRRAGARVDTVRGPALAQYVVAEATDGYRVLFSLGELAPSLGNQRVLLVDSVDGRPLPAEDGPWRLVVPAEMHPTRWARQVVTLRLAAAP